MALTLVSSPHDYGAAYAHGGLVFKLTSDKDPAPSEAATILQISPGSYNFNWQQYGVKDDDVVVEHTNFVHVKPGDYVKISGTTYTRYDGAIKVKKKLTSTLIVLDTGFNGYDYNGTITFHRRNFTVVGKLYLGSTVSGSPIATIPVTAKNTGDQYEFHVESYLQKELSTYVSTSLTLDGTIVGNTISRDYIMTFHERWDVPNSLGVGVATDYDDAADTVTSSSHHIVNASPQAFHIRNRTFETVITDTYESQFLVNLTNTGARFLTNMPKRVKIGHGSADADQDMFVLCALVKGGLAAGTYRRQVVAYDAAGGTTYTNTNFTKPTDTGVLAFNAGPKGLGIIAIPTDTVYYTVELQKDGSAITEQLRFDVYYDCRPGDRRFSWLNEHGGIDYFTFRGAERMSNVSSKTLSEGMLGSSPAITDRQARVSGVTTKDRFTSNTGIINAEHREWIRELVDSTEVSIFVHESWGFNYIPVNVAGSNIGLWTTQKTTGDISVQWSLSVTRKRQRA